MNVARTAPGSTPRAAGLRDGARRGGLGPRTDGQGRAPDAAAAVEERERISRALATLSESHRAIIMLVISRGSRTARSRVLEIPMGTVMSRLHNARRRLRDALGPLLA